MLYKVKTCFIECIYLQALINIEYIPHEQILIISKKGLNHILSDTFSSKVTVVHTMCVF